MVKSSPNIKRGWIDTNKNLKKSSLVVMLAMMVQVQDEGKTGNSFGKMDSGMCQDQGTGS